MAGQWLVMTGTMAGQWLVMAGTMASNGWSMASNGWSMAGQWLVMAGQWLVMAGNGWSWLVSEIRSEKLSLFVSDHYITISDVLYYSRII